MVRNDSKVCDRIGSIDLEPTSKRLLGTLPVTFPYRYTLMMKMERSGSPHHRISQLQVLLEIIVARETHSRFDRILSN